MVEGGKQLPPADNDARSRIIIICFLFAVKWYSCFNRQGEKRMESREKLVITLTIFAVIIMGMAMCGGCVDQKPTAERQARTYLHTMYPNAEHITFSCMNYDTDSNGYVSCDAVVDDEPVALECAANEMCFAFCNNGCKLRPMVQTAGRRRRVSNDGDQ